MTTATQPRTIAHIVWSAEHDRFIYTDTRRVVRNPHPIGPLYTLESRASPDDSIAMRARELSAHPTAVEVTLLSPESTPWHDGSDTIYAFRFYRTHKGPLQ